MINLFAQKLILTAFQIWTFDKADSYRQHMEIVLNKTEYTEQMIQQHADKFTYLPPNALIIKERNKTLVVDYRNHPTYRQ